MHKPKTSQLKFLIAVFILTFSAFTFFGCATAPIRENIPAYNIGGTTYYSLLALCDSRGINWQYDTFGKTVNLDKDSHKISLRIGDAMMLVDGQPRNFAHPVDIYQGVIVIPDKFKEQVLDVIFKKNYAAHKSSLVYSGIKKIVLDAGHGGNDPGTIGRSGAREKDVNLDITKRLKKILETEGIAVVMTRSSDRFIPLDSRAKIANDSGADLFISIHANANRVRSLHGFEVYYVSPTVSDTQRAYATAKSTPLNIERASLAGHSLDLKATLWDMVYTYGRAESIELSRAICRSMDDNSNSRIIGAKAARFAVLRGVHMPAVLIEVGFLSNADEEKMLKNSYSRQKIAENIAEGIAGYAQGFNPMEVAKR